MPKSNKSFDDMKQDQAQKNEKLKNRIVEKILDHVVFDGWTEKSIKAAFDECEINYDHFKNLFPMGMDDVMLHYGKWIDDQMLAKLENLDKSTLKIRERIFTAVKTRLEILEPHKEAVRRGAAYLANPLRASLSMRMLYKTVDDIWHWAGDNSTDFNFYTKRGLLAGVYTSTLLYWMNDETENHADSWEFLKRRIENVMSVGKTIGTMKQFCKDTNVAFFGDRFKNA